VLTRAGGVPCRGGVCPRESDKAAARADTPGPWANDGLSPPSGFANPGRGEPLLMGDPARTGSASLAVSSSRGTDDENGRCWERLGEEDLAMSCGIPLLDGEDMIAVIFKLVLA
jgi:hypothetical protein